MASAGRSAIVVTIDKLSFISSWAAASVLLVELGAPVFYVPGMAEETIGRGAPWFVLAALLSAFLLKSIYLSGDDPVAGAVDSRADRETGATPGRSWKVLLLL